MKDMLLLLADLWLMATAWTFGIKMYRNYDNHMLTLEWLVVAVSSTNFLVWSLLGGHKSSPLYHVAYALDAFSRSFGITLILVVGLLRVTHGYRPSLRVELGLVSLAVAGALVFGFMHNDHLVYDGPHVTLATFYVVANLLTAVFLAYFCVRLWQAGARSIAIWTALVTAAASYVAVIYDFFPWSFDDNDRTIFYIVALTTWGAQAVVYYYAYSAMHAHRVSTGADSEQTAEALV